MNAETQGKAGKKGQWSNKEPPRPHINDVSLPGTSGRWGCFPLCCCAQDVLAWEPPTYAGL